MQKKQWEITERSKEEIKESMVAVTAASALICQKFGLDAEKEESLRAAFIECYKLGYSEGAKNVRADFPVLRKPYQLHELSRELSKLTGQN